MPFPPIGRAREAERLPDHAGTTIAGLGCPSGRFPVPHHRGAMAPHRTEDSRMRKRTIIRDVRNAIPDRAADLAGRIGEGFRHGSGSAGKWLHDMPESAGKWLQGVPEGAGKWLQAGVAVGAARTGARAVGSVARKHPVAVTAAAVGIGAALYAVIRHRRKAAERAALEGRSQRIREALDAGDIDPHASDVGDRPVYGED